MCSTNECQEPFWYGLPQLLAEILAPVNLWPPLINHQSLDPSHSILGLQSISRDMADHVSHPRRLDPTMELITYSFVLYLQHGRHGVKCKPSIARNIFSVRNFPRTGT